MLCAKCISIFLHRYREVFGGDKTDKNRAYLHHKCREDVESAAQNGCRICFAVIANFASSGNWSSVYIDPRHSRFLMLVCGQSEKDARESEMVSRVIPQRLNYLRSPPQYLHYAEQVILDINKGLSSIVRADGFSRRSIPNCTGHDDNVTLARAWLDRCLKNHANCGDTDGSIADIHWQPKRLVDVTAPDGRLKVVERDKQAVSKPYAALSHCWGKEEFFTLNDKNHDAAVNGQILLEELPRSFRDVIDFCRRLGIQYIWIDSLCILQSGAHSKDDWLEHATAMRLIYSRCLLNIAVDCSASPHEGAFRDRDPISLGEAFVPSKLPGCEDLDVTNCRWNLITFFDDPRRNPRDGPLATRGWVVQERYLSPRILHFGTDRISWECSEFRTDESCPSDCLGNWDFTYFSGTPTEQDRCENPSSSFKPSATFTLSRRLYPAEPSSPEHLLEVTNEWLCIVSYYSRCDLTYPDKDKAIALEGIAQRLGALTPKSSYIAGLFSHNLPVGLVWHLVDSECSQMNTTRPPAVSISRAPSWSWLNANSHIEFAMMTPFVLSLQDPLGKWADQFIEDIRVIPQSHALQLRGWLLSKGTIDVAYTSSDLELVQDLTYYLDDGRDEYKQDGDWYLLPVGHYSGGSVFEMRGGLILYRTVVKWQYLRIGTYECSGKRGGLGSRAADEFRKYEKVDLMII